MTPAEAQVLLSMASAFDNRKPDADAAKAWAAALDGLRFEDCRLAVIEHYKTGNEWLMPSMVRVIVKRIRSKRIAAYGTLTSPPPNIDPDDPEAIIQWQAEETRRLGDGLPPTAHVAIEGPVRDVASLGAIGHPIPELEVLRKRLRASRAE